jgi:magnesium transporter
MDRAVKAVRSDVDQETVAEQFDRYDYYTLAVVDDRRRILGIVTVDDVIDIIRAEQTEDVQKTVGAGAGEAVYSGLREKFRGRFPWLGMSLLMTCAAAGVVLLFDDLIRRMPVLAFLMPVIAALVGNAGHQALAVTLRGIVLNEVRADRVWPLVLRECAVGVISGAVLGAAVCLGMGALNARFGGLGWQIGAVAGVSTAIAMGVGTLAGASIPLIMRRMGADPAQASAIFLIMVTDAVSFSVLLGLVYFLVGSS